MKGTFPEMKKLFSLFFFLIFLFSAKAQNKKDSLSNFSIPEIIIPTALISAGVLWNKSGFEKNIQLNLRNKVGQNFEFKIDNFLQYTPMASLLIADFSTLKRQNNNVNQAKYLLISNLITAGITHGLKRLTKKTRPNGSPFSFPSGHTSFAFTNATVLSKEYYATAPCLALSGYFFAGTTATFRLINNKHWLSDVLLGAGIGIAVPELVYYFEPLKNVQLFKFPKNLTFFPDFSGNKAEFYLSYSF